MNIDIEVSNIDCKIVTKLNIDQLAMVQQECQFKVENAEFKQFAFRNNNKRRFDWDGYRKLFNIQTRRFPVGLLSRVIALFNKYGITVNIINSRYTDDTKYDFIKSDEYKVRDYQFNAILSSVSNGNGIIKVATGGGKTVIAGYTIGALNKKSIFVVHTKDLLYQSKKVFENMFPYEKIGQIGDGIYDPQNITVATMQTLAILGNVEIGTNKYDEDSDTDEKEIESEKRQIVKANFNTKYRKSIQCVMMDEVQIVCSQMAYGVRFLFEYANYAFGYSASPWRDDGSDLMIEGAFGKRIVDIPASFLIERGYLVRPNIHIKNTYYDTHNQPTKYVEIYKKYIVENDMRNIQVCNDALSEYNKGYNTLILVTQIKHGEMLQDIMLAMGVDVSFISGKSGMKKRKQAIEDMRNGKISLLIASTIADVGLDIPRLHSIIEAGAGKSSVTALQRLGRIMRPFSNKSDCTFITYRDRVKYLKEQVDLKINIWRTEPLFNIIEEI